MFALRHDVHCSLITMRPVGNRIEKCLRKILRLRAAPLPSIYRKVQVIKYRPLFKSPFRNQFSKVGKWACPGIQIRFFFAFLFRLRARTRV